MFKWARKKTGGQKAHPHHPEKPYRCPNHFPLLDPLYDIDYIAYRIFVGALSAACKPVLLENHITHVLSIGVNPEEALSPEIIVKKIALQNKAKAKIEDILDEACQFIDEGTRGSNIILVHCRAGKSRSPAVVTRSPAVVINYLHRCKGLSLPCAFFLVSTRRPVMDLNVGFKNYLIKKSQKENSKIKTVHFRLPRESKHTDERFKLNKDYFKRNKERLEKEMGMSLEPPEEAVRDEIKITLPIPWQRGG